MPPINIFITGRPGIGKTTAVMTAIERLALPMHGFYTREMREDGSRVGFEIRDLQGGSATMAHVDFDGPPTVSKYGVDPEAVDRVGVAALRRALDEGTIAVLDEVGKMELASDAFVEILDELLDADIPVLGTVHAKQETHADRIRARDDS
ncbi:MAG: nucleoside-triphosphatase, partial [Planctomycetota bacterium]